MLVKDRNGNALVDRDSMQVIKDRRVSGFWLFLHKV